MVLRERGACLQREVREPLNEACRLHGTIGRVEDRATELRPQMWNLVMPFRCEAVFAECIVFCAYLGTLLVVCRNPKASSPSERITCDGFEPVDRTLGAQPEVVRRIGALGLTRYVVACCGAS
jgi:hypothetical protein